MLLKYSQVQKGCKDMIKIVAATGASNGICSDTINLALADWLIAYCTFSHSYMRALYLYIYFQISLWQLEFYVFFT